MSLYVVMFGVVTYYVIPFAVISANFGLFFTVLNCVCASSVIGMVFIMSVALPAMQRLLLHVILLCKPRDKQLGSIILNRLESGKARNLKISLMITSLLGFLVVT